MHTDTDRDSKAGSASASTASALTLRVDGMDCASCAVKIENALRRLPGVSDVVVSHSTGSLSLDVDEDRTSRDTIKRKITSLGYSPVEPASAHDHEHDHGAPEDGSVWFSRKAGLVLGTGVLLLAAFIISHLAPAWGEWAYIVATGVGLLPIARRALAGAMSGTPFSIETLMSVAAVGAVAIGQAGEATLVVFLFSVGEWLEGVAAGRARAGIRALINLVPRTAQRMRGDTVEVVPVETLAIGDIVVVRPGDRVPSDGIVREGASQVDESPVTGESVPVEKGLGAAVHAGSINANAELRIEITRTAADNTIARIIHMVETAQASRAPTARFIESFSRWYTPAAMVIALLVILTPPLLFSADWYTWVYRGLAVLLIACPCALVISTPAAIASGLANGAHRGLLIKGGAALETLGSVRTVAFDKTGTLTAGRPRVTDIVAERGDEEAMLAKAAAVEQGSSHPLGAAIIAEAQARGLTVPPTFGGSVAIPGKAVTARLKSGFVSVGSPRHAAEQDALAPDLQARIAALESDGKTVVIVREGTRVGAIALRDEPRADAREAIGRLRALDIRPVMLTGDNARTANAIGAALGIDVRAEMLPEAKLAAIAELKAAGGVAMAGDGINDAPALAAASVGIAMGGGTDVALETADAALLNQRLVGVADLISLSRATMANIWQNVTIALGLKGVFLVTTLLGATPLWVAILSDTGATVLVTANALRLLRLRGSAA